mmetsp:Transcript_37339/g.93264  ORF Transcript_37339/g.93264 Transcript_37339/m.93264 type:complete len:201 (+) Transcript_37339:511-1113(+)
MCAFPPAFTCRPLGRPPPAYADADASSLAASSSAFSASLAAFSALAFRRAASLRLPAALICSTISLKVSSLVICSSKYSKSRVSELVFGSSSASHQRPIDSLGSTPTAFMSAMMPMPKGSEYLNGEALICAKSSDASSSASDLPAASSSSASASALHLAASMSSAEYSAFRTASASTVSRVVEARNAVQSDSNPTEKMRE